jgi:hypothetical protein
MKNHRILVALASVLSTAALIAQGVSGCVFAPQDNCALTHGFPGCQGANTTGASSSSSAGGTGSASSTSMGGSGGSTPECTTDKQCMALTPPPGPCASLVIPSCQNQKCVLAYMPGPAPSQQYGSCHKNMCDADGGLTSPEDDTNFFDDGNPCTKDSCGMGGLWQNTPTIGANAPCALSLTTMGFCELDQDPQAGVFPVCSQCDPSVPSACPSSWVCYKYKCVPQHCTNTVQDFGESDLNCGGMDCPPCVKNQACFVASDCFSQVCTGHVCQAATCTDNVQNQDESDIDCGGSTCPACDQNSKCRKPTDCLSQVCKPKAPGDIDVCFPPTCTDGVKNSDETGVDCGGNGADAGLVCPPCAM